MELDALRMAVHADRYIITQHAKQRMGLRGVTDAAMKHVVATGDVIIEEYPAAQPFPKCLFMGIATCLAHSMAGMLLHWYDSGVWLDPWTRRRN